MVDWTIGRYTREFIASKAASGIADQRPLFIVGMYRSGTTLVEQIVTSHPDIAAGGELTVWTPTDIEIDATTGEFDPERAHSAIARYLSVLQKIAPSAARVTDKLPFNLFRLGAIHALMPNARIIHCQRDPIDTCLSIYSNLFKSRVSFAAQKRRPGIQLSAVPPHDGALAEGVAGRDFPGSAIRAADCRPRGGNQTPDRICRS